MQVGESATQARIVAATLAVLICGGLAVLFNVTLRPLLAGGGIAQVGEAVSLVPILFVHPTYEALEKRRLQPFHLTRDGIARSLRRSARPAHDQPWFLTALAWAAALAIATQVLAFLTGFGTALSGQSRIDFALLGFLFVILTAGIGFAFGIRKAPYAIRTVIVMTYLAGLIGNLVNWTMLSATEWHQHLGVSKSLPNLIVFALVGGTELLVAGLAGYGLGRLASLARRAPVAQPEPAPVPPPAPAPAVNASTPVLISPDGRHMWSGVDWQPLTMPVSRDRRYVWDGNRWVAARILPPPPA